VTEILQFSLRHVYRGLHAFIPQKERPMPCNETKHVFCWEPWMYSGQELLIMFSLLPTTRLPGKLR